MDAQEMKERIFRYMLRVRQQEEEGAQRVEKEGYYSAYSSGLAFGKVLAVGYIIGYLGLTKDFKKWSAEHEKGKNSQKN